MRLGKIVLKLRNADTAFDNYIAGAAEFSMAMKNTLTNEAAFVIPLNETANDNLHDTSINQKVVERFAIIVAVKNDSSQADKTGLTAYDRLHDIRGQLVGAVVGWEMIEAESMIYYRGGRLIEIDSAYMWYQFEFEYESRLQSQANGQLISVIFKERDINEYPEQPDSFDRIYANLILSPSAELPHDGSLPLADGYPSVRIPDMAQMIDTTDDPNRGSFAIGFGQGYPVYNR